jgi:hypothetical protein
MSSALDRLDAIARGFQSLHPREQAEIIGELDKATREEIDNATYAKTRHLKFVPNGGVQQRAYFCLADLLFYGGQGGGGKSALGVGLPFNEHRNALIVRKQFANLGGLTRLAITFNGSREGYSGGSRPKLVTQDGRLIAFGANQHEGDEQAFQGDPYDYKYFDEGSQLMESQVRFHLGWLRLGPGVPSTQRRRAIIGSNPPLDATGEWVVGMFRPWLDLTHPKPAQDGELRWFITDERGEDAEVDGPLPIERGGQTYIPSSRTFIRARLEDNPYLTVDSEYQKQLDALPEPVRSAVRDGNFMAARPDADRQVIPLAWIMEAQARWKPEGFRRYFMTAMAIDPAGGGRDAAEIVYRHGGWFGEPVTRKGEETADGSAMAAEIFKVRRNGCPVVVDVGGGYGGPVMMRLGDNQVACTRFDGGGASNAIARDGSKLRFTNKRAEAWWRMREALNPDQEGGSIIALPPNPELRSDLAAPTYEIRANGILIEPKDKLRERLGRSPGKGDAAVMCLSEGQRAVERNIVARQNGGQMVANTGGRVMATVRR